VSAVFVSFEGLKVFIAFMETHLRTTWRHLSYYEITVLPVTRHRWTRPALTPARQTGTRFTYPGGMEGWVDHQLGRMDERTDGL